MKLEKLKYMPNYTIHEVQMRKGKPHWGRGYIKNLLPNKTVFTRDVTKAKVFEFKSITEAKGFTKALTLLLKGTYYASKTRLPKSVN